MTMMMHVTIVMVAAVTCIALRRAVCRSKHESTAAPAHPSALTTMPTTNTSPFHDDNTHHTAHLKSASVGNQRLEPCADLLLRLSQRVSNEHLKTALLLLLHVLLLHMLRGLHHGRISGEKTDRSCSCCCC
jgi:hypothetical protein